MVRGVAVGAIGGDGQAGLQQPLAMDALAVMVHDVTLLAGIANGGLVPLLVAFSAQGGDVARIRGIGGIELAQRPVRAVAVLAEGRIGTALRSQRAVRAFAVLVHLLVVADGAIHLILNGVAGSHVGRGPAGMALHAGDARMTRVGQFIGADV